MYYVMIAKFNKPQKLLESIKVLEDIDSRVFPDGRVAVLGSKLLEVLSKDMFRSPYGFQVFDGHGVYQKGIFKISTYPYPYQKTSVRYELLESGYVLVHQAYKQFPTLRVCRRDLKSPNPRALCLVHDLGYDVYEIEPL